LQAGVAPEMNFKTMKIEVTKVGNLNRETMLTLANHVKQLPPEAVFGYLISLAIHASERAPFLQHPLPRAAAAEFIVNHWQASNAP